MDSEKDLEIKLREFPSNFDLDIINEVKEITFQYLEKKTEKLIGDSNHLILFDTEMEKCRLLNLVSFLCYKVGKVESAKEYNEQVLKICEDNIVALGNKAWIFLKEKERYKEIEEICEKLRSMRDRKLHVLVGKSEVAYSLTKIGLPFYRRACQRYNDIIKAAEAFPIPEEVLLNWKFELAFTEKRLLHINNANDEAFSNMNIKKYIDVANLFLCISQTKSEKRSIKRLKAKAFVELGFIAYTANKHRKLFPNGITDILPTLGDWTTDKFFSTASDIFPEDFLVLERSGKYFRYIGKIEMSIETLEKSIEIKETSSGHHHLALSLQRKLEMHPKSLNREEYLKQQLKSICQIMSDNKRKDNENCPTRTSKIVTVYGSKKNITPLRTHDTSDQRPNAIKQLIKCPKQVKFIDKGDKATIEKILMHFDKSVELNGNCTARYDKGLLFRATGEPDKALEAFKFIIKDKNQQCSPMQRLNSYEQAGFCLYDMLSSEEADTEIEENEKKNQLLAEDMIMYFKNSIEISCRIVAKTPFLEYCWESAPTLKSLLAGETEIKEQERHRLKDLLFLHEQFKHYCDAIEVLKKLRELTEDESQKTKLQNDLVQQCINAEKYDDAIVTLSLILLLPNGHSRVDESLYLKACLLGGLDVLRKGDKELARDRFHDMLDFPRFKSVCKTQENAGNGIEDRFSNDDDGKIKDTFDIFIITSEENENAGRLLEEIFEMFTIKTTVNLESVKFGRSISEGFESIVMSSKHAIVVCDEYVQNEGYFVTIRDEFQRRGHGSIILVTKSTCTNPAVPKILSACRKVAVDFKDIETGSQLIDNDTVYNKVKEILWKLTNTNSEFV